MEDATLSLSFMSKADPNPLGSYVSLAGEVASLKILSDLGACTEIL